MIAVFKRNTPLQARSLVKQDFVGLSIGVSGTVRSIEDVGGNYVTFSFYDDADGVYISANFDKPASRELAVFNKGDKIKVRGEVFNVGARLVSLDAGNVRLCHAQATDFILANHKVLTKGCSRRAGLLWKYPTHFVGNNLTARG